MEPSVEFLKPIGIDRPLASSRWTWLSVFRAPIAPQQIRSHRYCGVIGSSHSMAVGRPSDSTSVSTLRASHMPLRMLNRPSRSGSLISPFHPMVVRGFSKYVRMTMTRRSLSSRFTAARRSAYSRAAFGSWIEQGPTMTSRRSSRPCSTSRISCRERSTRSLISSVRGNSRRNARGAGIGSSWRILTSTVSGKTARSSKRCSSSELSGPRRPAILHLSSSWRCGAPPTVILNTPP